jgi:hypothetical protein
MKYKPFALFSLNAATGFSQIATPGCYGPSDLGSAAFISEKA